MNRRLFLKDMVIGSAAAGMAPGILLGQGQAKGAGQFPAMSIVEGESPYAITKEAVAMVGGMGRFIKKGDKVVIKPNIGWDRTPEMGACTNPEIVKCLIELTFNAGAKSVTIIDNTTNQAKRCYIRSGIMDAVKQTDGKLVYVDEQRIKKMKLNGEWIKEWDVVQDVIEADKIINVPIAKHHSLCRLTLGFKNWLGGTGGARNQFHQNLDCAIVDLAAFFKPQLTLLDAYRIMLRNGPQGGRLSDVKLVKKVIASTDPVAADSYATTFFNMTAADLPYLKLAKDRGLGSTELEKVHFETRKI